MVFASIGDQEIEGEMLLVVGEVALEVGPGSEVKGTGEVSCVVASGIGFEVDGDVDGEMA